MSPLLTAVRSRSCEGKRKYYLKADAVLAARRVPKKEGRKAKAYPCHFAPVHTPHFHVGHNFSDREGRLKIDIPAFVSAHAREVQNELG